MFKENYFEFTNKKFDCPIINENYAFKQIEIDGVKYPKYEYDSLLNLKYNYSCLNKLSNITKKIHFLYNPIRYSAYRKRYSCKVPSK
jgi:hypothetical protein